MKETFTHTDASQDRERRWLQRAVALFTLIPVTAGSAGILFGPAMIDTINAGASMDSHYRYLSGLLLGLGLCFWTTVPGIEHKAGRFRLLTLLVVVGGLGRLAGWFLIGTPSLAMMGGLAMELVVTPLLCIWQARIAYKYDV